MIKNKHKIPLDPPTINPIVIRKPKVTIKIKPKFKKISKTLNQKSLPNNRIFLIRQFRKKM